MSWQAFITIGLLAGLETGLLTQCGLHALEECTIAPLPTVLRLGRRQRCRGNVRDAGGRQAKANAHAEPHGTKGLEKFALAGIFNRHRRRRGWCFVVALHDSSSTSAGQHAAAGRQGISAALIRERRNLNNSGDDAQDYFLLLFTPQQTIGHDLRQGNVSRAPLRVGWCVPRGLENPNCLFKCVAENPVLQVHGATDQVDHRIPTRTGRTAKRTIQDIANRIDKGSAQTDAAQHVGCVWIVGLCGIWPVQAKRLHVDEACRRQARKRSNAAISLHDDLARGRINPDGPCFDGYRYEIPKGAVIAIQFDGQGLLQIRAVWRIPGECPCQQRV